MNVAKNAINYTPQGGRIRIAVEPNYQGEVDITISDTGMGIPEKDLIHIFEPFYTTENKGTGLGLYISRELCESNQARLDYQRRQGGGSCLRITFAHSRKLS